MNQCIQSLQRINTRCLHHYIAMIQRVLSIYLTIHSLIHPYIHPSIHPALNIAKV